VLIGFQHRLAAAPVAVVSDVPIAEGGHGRLTTIRRLLVEALADLLAEIGE
jgi:hypothetical protein